MNVIIVLFFVLCLFVNVIVGLGSVVSRGIIVIIYLYQLEASGITETATYGLPSSLC